MTIGLDLQRGQSLLIRGGTASVGLAATAIAKDLAVTVLSTTRQRDRADALKAHGVDYPVVDAGQVAPLVREIVPDGWSLYLAANSSTRRGPPIECLYGPAVVVLAEDVILSQTLRVTLLGPSRGEERDF